MKNLIYPNSKLKINYRQFKKHKLKKLYKQRKIKMHKHMLL